MASLHRHQLTVSGPSKGDSGQWESNPNGLDKDSNERYKDQREQTVADDAHALEK